MSRHNRYPPLPVSLDIGNYNTTRRFEATVRAAEEAKKPPLPFDRIEAIHDAYTRGDMAALRELLKTEQAEQTPQGFMGKITGALEKLALPFEAFTEGMNALVGALPGNIGGETFERRGAEARTVLKLMFGGSIDPAEAAGLLRESHRRRSTVEQLITGVLFDLLNVVPGVVVGKALRATRIPGAGVAARAAELTLGPPISPRVFAHSPRTASRLIQKAARGAMTEEEWRGLRAVAGASDEDDAPLLVRQRVLGDADLTRMRAAAENDLSRLNFRIFEETAARPGEVGRLRVGDVDWGTGRLTFRGADLKRESLSRPLTPELLEELRRSLESRGVLGNPDAPLFPTGRGNPWGAEGDTENLRRLAERAGVTIADAEGRPVPVEKLKGNIVRASIATKYARELAQSGVSLRVVSHLLRHADLKTTLRFYVREGLPLPPEYSALNDLLVNPIGVSEKWQARVAAAEEKFRNTTGVGAEFVGRRKGGEASKTTAKREWLTNEGRGKIENMAIEEGLDAAIEALTLPSSQKELVRAAIKAQKAARLLLEGQHLDEILTSRRELAGKASKEAKALAMEHSDLHLELQKLAHGLVEHFDVVLGGASARRVVDETLVKLFPDEFSRRIVRDAVFGSAETALRFLDNLAERGAKYRPVRAPHKLLVQHGLSAKQLKENPIMQTLVGVDALKREELVSNLLNNEGFQFLMASRGLVLKEGQFIATPGQFRRALAQNVRSGMYPRLMGSEFSQMSAEEASKQLDIFTSETVRLNWLKEPVEEAADSAVAVSKTRGFDPERAAQFVQQPRPVVPPDMVKDAKAFADDVVGTVMSVEDIHKAVGGAGTLHRPYQALKGWKSKLGVQVVAARIAQAMEITTLRGGVSSNIGSMLRAWSEAVRQAIRSGEGAMAQWRVQPGAKRLMAAFNPETNRFEGIRVKEVLPGIQKRVRGQERFLSGEQGMLHQHSIMRDVPIGELTRYYDWDSVEGGREMLAAVLALRHMTRRVTELAEGMGLKLQELMPKGVTLNPDYFPTISTRKNLFPIDRARVLGGARETWLKERQYDNAAQAFLAGEVYHAPWLAVERYHSEILGMAADKQLTNLLKKNRLVMSAIENPSRAGAALTRLRDDMIAGAPLGLKDQESALRYFPKLAREVMRSAENAKLASARVDFEADKVGKAFEFAAETKRKFLDKTPGMRGMLFDRAESKEVMDFFVDGQKSWTSVAQSVNTASAVLRFMKAGVDFSVMFIHGLPLVMSLDPAKWMVWGRATKQMARLMVTKDMATVRAQYLRMTRLDADDLLKHGGLLGAPFEMGEAAAAGAALPRVLRQHLWRPGKFLASSAERFEQGFTFWQDVARIELWKGMKGMAAGDEKKLFELASFVNNMTGTYNAALAGMPQLQHYLEGSMLSFAPTYRRAAFALIHEALKGVYYSGGHIIGKTAPPSLRASESMRALGSLMAAGTIWFGILPYLASKGNMPFGNKDALNPSTPKFLTMRVGNFNLGIGSAYYSIARAAWAIRKQAIEEPGKFVSTVDPRQNAILKYWRSQAPPIVSSGIDFLLGQTYIGEQLRAPDEGLDEWATVKWALLHGVPIAMESLLRDVRSPEDLSVAAEAAGGRVFPVSLFERRANLRENLLQQSNNPRVAAWREKNPGKGYGEMPKLFQVMLAQDNQDLAAMDLEIEADSIRRGFDIRRDVSEYLMKVRVNRENIDKDITSLAGRFQSGKIDARKFRDEMGANGALLAKLHASLLDNPRYKAASEYLNSRKKEGGLTAEFIGDHAFDEYMRDVLLNANNTAPDGSFMPDVFDTADNEFRKVYGEEIYRYVQERRRISRDVPEVVREFWSAQIALREYWKAHDKIWSSSSWQHDTIEGYFTMTSFAQAAQRAEMPVINRLLRLVDRARERIRKSNPELDWMLVKFYGYTPLTALARTRLVAFRDLQARAG